MQGALLLLSPVIVFVAGLLGAATFSDARRAAWPIAAGLVWAAVTAATLATTLQG